MAGYSEGLMAPVPTFRIQVKVGLQYECKIDWMRLCHGFSLSVLILE